MKNTIITLTILLVFIATIGCSTDDETDTPDSNNPTRSNITEENQSDDGELHNLVSSFVTDFIVDRVDTWADGLVAATIMDSETRETINTEILNLDISVISMNDNRAIVEAIYDTETNIGASTVESTPSGAEMNIAPQTLEFHLYQTMELVMLDGQWSVEDFYDGPASEKLKNELSNIQNAVTMMMAEPQVNQLDADYFGIDTEIETENVTAGEGIYSLALYYQPFKYPYSQPYDITRSGTVTATLKSD